MNLDAALASPSPIRGHLEVLRRRKWILLQAVALVPLAAVLVSLKQEMLYKASAQVLLSHQNLAAALTGTADTSQFQSEDRFAQTQAELARVPTVAVRALRLSGTRNMSPAAFLSRSEVAPAPGSDLLTFSVKNGGPGVAARLVNAYARAFTQYRRELDTTSLKSARAEVQARIDQLTASGDRRSALYASLVSKEQQLGTMEALQTSNAHVVREATKATQVQPRPVRAGILGLFLGLVLGAGLAFLREALDTRVRSAEEIGEHIGLPLLARLPEPPRRLRNRSQLLMLAKPDGLEAEAFRMLRTNLEFVNLERGARTILVTSAVQGEGKSTTVANLAVALARAGRKIVLVDLDLRHPILGRFFEATGREGLTDVALGHARLDDVLVRVALKAEGSVGFSGNGRSPMTGMLELLPSGPVPPNAGEFVGTHAVSEIVYKLRERADLVLIDTPPLLQVGDAMTLSGAVDALIVVARLNLLRRPILKELERVLASSPAAKLGFVLTGADSEESGYGYAYGYSGSRTAAEKTAARA